MKNRKQKEGAFRVRRLNWFDWGLLGLLAAGLVGGFFALRSMSMRTDGEEGTLVYTVVISNLEDPLFSADGETEIFAVGDPVKTQNGTAILGTVSEIRREVHRSASVAGGKIVFAEVADRFDYYVTVHSDAHRKAGDGIRIGDIRMAAGMTVTLRIGDFYAPSAQVISAEWEADRDA